MLFLKCQIIVLHKTKKTTKEIAEITFKLRTVQHMKGQWWNIILGKNVVGKKSCMVLFFF